MAAKKTKKKAAKKKPQKRKKVFKKPKRRFRRREIVSTEKIRKDSEGRERVRETLLCGHKLVWILGAGGDERYREAKNRDCWECCK